MLFNAQYSHCKNKQYLIIKNSIERDSIALCAMYQQVNLYNANNFIENTIFFPSV